MERVFTDKVVTAKKHYRCDASEQWRRAGYTVADCETSEQRMIVEAAEADKFRILPGQAYRKVTGFTMAIFALTGQDLAWIRSAMTSTCLMNEAVHNASLSGASPLFGEASARSES